MKTAGTIELERKFSVPSLVRLTAIRNAIIPARINVRGDIFTANDAKTKPQLDSYYDSADLQFFNRHCGTFRIRDKGDALQVTLKQPLARQGKTSARSEDEEEITRAQLETLSAHRLFVQAKEILGGSELLPTLSVNNLRTTILFSHNDKQIEVCLDHIVRFTDLRPSGKGKTSGPRFELEIENKNAPTNVFEQFIDALRTLEELKGLRRSSGAKYERGVIALRINR